MVDPITVSVVQHRLGAIVEEMGEAMLRTSYSRTLDSSRDFSTGICYPDGRLVAQAEHVPIHVGALPWAAKAVSDYLGEDIHPGDVFLLNDPYPGGNHRPDPTAFVGEHSDEARWRELRDGFVTAPAAGLDDVVAGNGTAGGAE